MSHGLVIISISSVFITRFSNETWFFKITDFSVCSGGHLNGIAPITLQQIFESRGDPGLLDKLSSASRTLSLVENLWLPKPAIRKVGGH
jgi:hypothetical protein